MKNHSLDIACPHCGECAQFHEPFQFLTKRKFRSAPEGFHIWGRLMVKEVFPNDFPWEKPKSDRPLFHHSWQEQGDGYTLNHQGMISCPSCDIFEKSEIRWPDSAFWKWEENGSEVVARNIDHAIEIYHFLSSAKRTPNRKPSLRSLTTQNMKRSTSIKIAETMERDLAEAIA